MEFKDYFSDNSAAYSRYRPCYPEALFEYLASMTPECECAWDCATGTGQSAQRLAAYFQRVIASDASKFQIASAVRKRNILYVNAPAERSGLKNSVIDLVTVAQALHWFDIQAFFQEVGRVLKPGGVLAVWCYNLVSISPQLDRVINNFYNDVIGDYWPPERIMIEEGYGAVSFPFEKLAAPSLEMRQEWNLPQLLGYFRTWSAVKRYLAAGNYDPLENLKDEMLKFWKDSEIRLPIVWPLRIHIRRKR